MTDQKKARRPVALPRLHQSIEEFCAEHDIDTELPIVELLDAVQAEWFKGAKK